MVITETSARSKSCEGPGHALEAETCSPVTRESCEGKDCSEMLCEH